MNQAHESIILVRILLRSLLGFLVHSGVRLILVSSVSLSYDHSFDLFCQLDEFLAEIFEHAVEVSLVLMILIDHEDAALLVVPLNVGLETDLVALVVAREERKVS